MAVIEARGRGYRARVRIKGAPGQSAAFERLTDARRWAQQTEAAIREGRHFKTSEAKKHTAGELIDRYIRDVIPPPEAVPTFVSNAPEILSEEDFRLAVFHLARVARLPP